MDFIQDFARSKDFLYDTNRSPEEKLKIVKDLIQSFDQSFSRIDLNSNFLLEFRTSLDFQKSQVENKRKVKEMMLVNQQKYLETQKKNDDKLITMENEIERLRNQIVECQNTKNEALREKSLKELELDEKKSFYNEYFQKETELHQAVETIRAKRQEILISKNSAISQKQEAELLQLDLSTSQLESNKDANQRVFTQSSHTIHQKPLKPSIETLLTLLIILVSLLFFLS